MKQHTQPHTFFLRLCLGWLCWWLVGVAWSQTLPPCRMAFDMGSSGIRAGTSVQDQTPRIQIDYLTPAKHGQFEQVTDATIAALLNLPKTGNLATDCAKVGGGFSAWRLALEHDPIHLTRMLATIQSISQVSVLVIPQNTEGAYGYWGASQKLGQRLQSSHILDIGGGSLQVAGLRSTFGIPLGQKVWHETLCQVIRETTGPCALPPLTDRDLLTARTLLDGRLQDIPLALPQPLTLTAISRPVTQGIAPALQRLNGWNHAPETLALTDIQLAIEQLSTQPAPASTSLSTYLLSDLLLVEGVMRATHTRLLHIADVDLTNLPGLLADDRAFAWGQRYSCYLDRLREIGLQAYASNPDSCPEALRGR